MAADLFYSLFVTTAISALIFLVGAVILSKTNWCSQSTGVGFLAYSVAHGICFFALLGVVVVSLPIRYEISSCIAMAGAFLLALFGWHRYNIISYLLTKGRTHVFHAFIAWIMAAWVSMFVVHMPVKYPSTLPDGAYVLKSHDLNVKVQRILGDLPADNYIPFAVQQYLLRDIQFSIERPIMPGQELSNRPILASLASIPFQSVLQPPMRATKALPKFSYVGSRWPDVGVFNQGRGYLLFLCALVVFNGSLILALALLLDHLQIPTVYRAAAYALFVTNPYFLGQTLFAWPKALAGFFVVLSSMLLLNRKNYPAAGILCALAYWSHPYALTYLLCFSALAMWQSFENKKLSGLSFGLFSGLGILPWFLWTRLYLNIPSDLVQQNLAAPSFQEAVIARIINLRNTIMPPPESWLSLNSYSKVAIISLVGALGVVLLPGALGSMIHYIRRFPREVMFLAVLPCGMIVGVFSNFNLPALHGMQPFAMALFTGSIWYLASRLTIRTCLTLIICQFMLNLVLWAARFHALNAGV